mmetsp:Transcript_48160/g.85111  ORF Transcript_48160/g.85111 Transcript_48160/m.85111 type:complete len:82 (-) Transcript_48160:17-262(-)
MTSSPIRRGGPLPGVRVTALALPRKKALRSQKHFVLHSKGVLIDMQQGQDGPRSLGPRCGGLHEDRRRDPRALADQYLALR